MIKVNCLNPIAKVGLDLFDDRYQLDAPLEEAQLVLVRSADMTTMKMPSDLRAIARAGAGVNNIPLEECAEQGIVVFNTPGANANGVKELVLAGMLLAARDVVGGVEWVKRNGQNPQIAKETEKAKKQFAGTEIWGKRLGIIGLGNIGVKVANAALALGMEVWGYTLPLGDGTIPGLDERVKRLDTADEIYRQCDYITLHLPLTADNERMLNKAVLDTMKLNAVVLNFSRDKLVDEEALGAALEAGKLGGYVTDFPNPTVANLPGVLVFPHLGASTEESEDNCAKMAVQQLRDFSENGTLKNTVNYPNCTLGKKSEAQRICVLGKELQPEQVLTGLQVLQTSSAQQNGWSCILADLKEPLTQQQQQKIKNIPGITRLRFW